MTFPQEALEVITAAKSSGPVAELLNRYGSEAATRAGNILTEAIVLGTHSDVIGRRLSDTLAVPLWKGAQIARTEINRAYQESLRETWRQNKEITPKWIWRSGRTSSTCAVCFPAGTIVSGPRVEKVFSRHYVGDVVTIKTAGGKELTATPNHPILTGSGWVAAGVLKEGDHVISGSGRKGAAALIDVDHQQMPTRIEEVAVSLGMVPTEVPCATPDFHGDGKGSDVYVVWTDRLLRGDRNSPIAEGIEQDAFGVRGPRGHSLSGAGLELFGGADPLLDVMNIRAGMILENGIAGLERNGAGSNRIGLGSGSPSNTGILEASGYRGAIDPERLGESVFGFAGDVAGGNLGIGEIEDRMSLSPDLWAGLESTRTNGPDHPAFAQDSQQSLVVDVIPTSDDLRPFAGDVVADRILNVSISRFSGHVYNLQTETGWYIADGVIVHNCWAMDGTEHDVEEPMGSHVACRCSMIPATVSWDDLAAQFGIEMPAGDYDPPKEPTGAEAFDRLPAAQQRSVLGPGKFQAFVDGLIQLEDLVQERRSEDWGLSRSEGSLSRAKELAAKRGSWR
jgi:hypothetical protein